MVVHRLLMASLGLEPLPPSYAEDRERTLVVVSHLASHVFSHACLAHAAPLFAKVNRGRRLFAAGLHILKKGKEKRK